MKRVLGWILMTFLGLWLSLVQPAAADGSLCSQTQPFTSDQMGWQVKPVANRPAFDSSQDWATQCFLKAGQAGVEACQCAIATSPFNATLWNNLGQKLFHLQHYDRALRAYDHALLIEPKYSLALANRCGLLSVLKHYAEALSSCDLALRSNKHWGTYGEAIAWDNRGDVLFNLERYQESLDSFNHALAVNPDYIHALHNREVVLRKLQQEAPN